jgi:hypothetical protein
MNRGNENEKDWRFGRELRDLDPGDPDDSAKARMLSGIVSGMEERSWPGWNRLRLAAACSAAILIATAAGIWLYGLPEIVRPEAQMREASTRSRTVETAPVPGARPWVDESGAVAASGVPVSGVAGAPRTLRILSESGNRAVAQVREDGEFEPDSGGEINGRVLSGAVDFEVEKTGTGETRFAVMAEGVKVSVVGTAFAVSVKDHVVTVSVKRGAVLVEGAARRLLREGERWSSAGVAEPGGSALPSAIKRIPHSAAHGFPATAPEPKGDSVKEAPAGPQEKPDRPGTGRKEVEKHEQGAAPGIKGAGVPANKETPRGTGPGENPSNDRVEEKASPEKPDAMEKDDDRRDREEDQEDRAGRRRNKAKASHKEKKHRTK